MKLLDRCKLANEKLAELADAEKANSVAENIFENALANWREPANR